MKMTILLLEAKIIEDDDEDLFLCLVGPGRRRMSEDNGSNDLVLLTEFTFIIS
jgi:hypothetical protein